MESKLAPGFLIASPHMRDPFFEKSVVFLLEHDDDEGSFGIILNKVADIDLHDVFSELGVTVNDDIIKKISHPVLEGGPVTPELGWIIHTPDWTSEKTRTFEGEICITASMEILNEIAAGKGPSQFWFCLGYSGWDSEQLIGEIRSGAWLNIPFDSSLFFDVSIKDKWNAAMERLGIDPAHLSPIVGGA